MKKNFGKYGLQVLLLLTSALFPVSCITEDYPEGEKASVTMTFTARAPEVSSSGALLNNEQMQNLRVIVARGGTNDILYNLTYQIAPEETSKTIRFGELTISEEGEDIDFYAIANETAFLNNGESLEGENVDLAALKQRILRKDFNNPALSLIPQAAFKTIKVGKNQNKIASMKLVFPVAKVQLSFDNQTGSPATLTNVHISGIADQGYLFKDIMPSYPSGTSQKGTVRFGNNGTLEVPVTPASDMSPYVRYLYPGQKTTAYKLSATWGNKTYETTFKLNGEELTAIANGQQFNFRITLVANRLKVALEVLPWNVDDAEIDFSTEFNGLLNPESTGSLKVVESEGTKSIAVATANDGTPREAKFSFKMLSPVGVRWTAHLDNTNDFELVGEPSGYGAADAVPVLFSVKPKKNFDATNPLSVKLFITVTSPFGESSSDGIQVINPEENGVYRFPGTATEIYIRQVSEEIFDGLTETVNTKE